MHESTPRKVICWWTSDNHGHDDEDDNEDDNDDNDFDDDDNEVMNQRGERRGSAGICEDK